MMENIERVRFSLKGGADADREYRVDRAGLLGLLAGKGGILLTGNVGSAVQAVAGADPNATELAAAGESERAVGGTALPYEVRTERLPGLFFEFAGGAFRESIARDDVRLLVGHDDGSIPLARTSARTLSVVDEERGVTFRATLAADSPLAASTYSAVQRGDLSEMSVGFTAEADDIELRALPEGSLLVRFTRARLWEMSLVNWGQYQDAATAGTLRVLTPTDPPPSDAPAPRPIIV